MTFELTLIGMAIHILVWEKLPEWGDWFTKFRKKMPKPLQALYEQWQCPYCAGFWIALTLHVLTGMWTIPKLADLPSYLGPFAPLIGWSLDALVTATLIYAGIIALKAIGLPAMKAEMMKKEFMQTMFPGDKKLPQKKE